VDWDVKMLRARSWEVEEDEDEDGNGKIMSLKRFSG